MDNLTETIKAVNAAVEKLMDQLFIKQDELARRESSNGTYHNVAKMNRLRSEIASIYKRLDRAERLQEQALRGL